MGFGFSMSELLLIAFIVMMLFGTKKLGSIGSDLGNAIRGFKNAMNQPDTSASSTTQQPHLTGLESRPEQSSESSQSTK